jgi:hypothetical protein
MHYPAIIHGPMPVLPTSKLPTLKLCLESGPEGTPLTSSGLSISTANILHPQL